MAERMTRLEGVAEELARSMRWNESRTTIILLNSEQKAGHALATGLLGIARAMVEIEISKIKEPGDGRR